MALPRSTNWRCLLFWLCIIGLCPLSAAAGPFLLVNGHDSDNVVRFDLDTGVASVYAQYNSGDRPRHLAMRDDGALFATLNGGQQNVVQLVRSGALLSPIDFTTGIGNFGPSHIAFSNGDLYVSGDRSRVIFHYDGTTGNEVRTFSVTTDFNILGMAISGSNLYYAEVFQNTIRTHDLTQAPPPGGTLVSNSSDLFEPIGMTVGHNGNLFLTNRQSPLVQEFDIATGQFVGTFADLSAFDGSLTSGSYIHYAPTVGDYFVTAADTVFRIGQSGTLQATYQSGLLQGATGVILAPEPNALLLALLGTALFAPAARRSGSHWRRKPSRGLRNDSTPCRA